jgi:Spy/CpxP family protein refolding chaperone
MRFNIILLIIASIIAGIVCVVLVSADITSGGIEESAVRQKIAKKLDLTQDQRAKLKILGTGLTAQNKDTQNKIKDIREQEKKELLSPSPSQPALYGYAKEINDLQGAMAEKRLEHLLKVKEILTPDQFKKLLSIRFHGQWGHGWKHGDQASKG